MMSCTMKTLVIPCSIENRSVHWEDMRAFWNVGRSCLASRTAHAPAPTPPNRPTAKTFVRPSTHGALKAARTLAGSRRLPHAHGRTGCLHVHPTSQHEAPGLMLCLEHRPLPSDSFSAVLGITWRHLSSLRSAIHQPQRGCGLQPRVSRASARQPWDRTPTTGKQTQHSITYHAHQQRLH